MNIETMTIAQLLQYASMPAAAGGIVLYLIAYLREWYPRSEPKTRLERFRHFALWTSLGTRLSAYALILLVTTIASALYALITNQDMPTLVQSALVASFGFVVNQMAQTTLPKDTTIR